jgi:carbonic anhydrase
LKNILEFLKNNRRWAAAKQDADPRYFDSLTEGQKPVALLLGCSDSRVSPAVVLGSDLGEIFVHRNIANVVSHADLNFLSVLQYAVEVLGVQHIIVYGHYGCGGVQAAMQDEAYGLIDNWLANIKDVIELHLNELNVIPDEHDRLDRLVELNVLEQIKNLRLTSVYRKAMKAGKKLHLHGWVYNFATGLVNVLTPEEEVAAAPGRWH